MFNFKKKSEPQVFNGRFITEDEIKDMIESKSQSFLKSELKELNDSVEKIRHFGE